MKKNEKMKKMENNEKKCESIYDSVKCKRNR